MRLPAWCGHLGVKLEADGLALFVEDGSEILDSPDLHDAKDGTWSYDYGRAAQILAEKLQEKGWILVPPGVDVPWISAVE